MRAMRLGPALLVFACGLAAMPVHAQTCPPNDPLCTKDSSGKKDEKAQKQKSDHDDEQPAAADAKPVEAPGKPIAKPAEPPKTPPAKAAEAPARGVITLAEVTITGRVQKPIAAVDVGRINPHLTLTELRQPFLDRIEKVIYSDPF